MQKLRLVYGVTVRQTATDFGCSPSHISRVERGDTKPSRALVQFYEERFEADGMLLSLLEAVEHAAEQNRRRFGGRRPKLVRAVEGDRIWNYRHQVTHRRANPFHMKVGLTATLSFGGNVARRSARLSSWWTTHVGDGLMRSSPPPDRSGHFRLDPREANGPASQETVQVEIHRMYTLVHDRLESALAAL